MSTSSLVAGISGLKTSQVALNVIGDNLANLNTSGFKSSRVNFANELSQTMRSALAPSGGLGGRNPIQVGTGTKVSSIDKIFLRATCHQLVAHLTLQYRVMVFSCFQMVLKITSQG